MAIEASSVQTNDMVTFAGSANWDRVGQRLTITNRSVSGIAFMAYRDGSPTGTITHTIRLVSSDSIIASTVWGNAADVPTNTAGNWMVASFTAATAISGSVRILMEWSGNLGDGSNRLLIKGDSGASTANITSRKAGTAAYVDTTGWLFTNYYIYEAAGTVTVVSTQKTTAVSGSTATGNGRLEVFATTAGVTEYGHCWNTSTNPSTALATKTTLGASTTLGAFTSGITALTPGTLYYVRAYGTDASSTYYGSNVTFTGGDSLPGSIIEAGEIAIVQTDFHWVGDDGVERFITGSVVA